MLSHVPGKTNNITTVKLNTIIKLFTILPFNKSVTTTIKRKLKIRTKRQSERETELVFDIGFLPVLSKLKVDSLKLTTALVIGFYQILATS